MVRIILARFMKLKTKRKETHSKYQKPEEVYAKSYLLGYSLTKKGSRLEMKRGFFFLGLVLLAFYLTSCSAILIKTEGSAEGINYKITGESDLEKTVEILDQGNNKFTHWLYLNCDYIFGCFMRCEGPVNSCIKVASRIKFGIRYIVTQQK